MAPRPRLAPAHDRTLGSQPQPPTAHTRRTKVTNLRIEELGQNWDRGCSNYSGWAMQNCKLARTNRKCRLPLHD
uniref:Uncharacterized protein n=1 Tax=Oryza meridionalis TaxID=40149 RepID=A0A0E0ELB3_9ORYZ